MPPFRESGNKGGGPAGPGVCVSSRTQHNNTQTPVTRILRKYTGTVPVREHENHPCVLTKRVTS